MLSPSNEHTKSNYSLLYIEDKDEVRAKYLYYFKQNYEKVYEAPNAKKALEIYKLYKPRIIICDINLPDINGLEILKIIRQHDHQTRIIMLTAYSDTPKLLNAVKLKLTDYLVKPVSRESLKKALQVAHFEIETYEVTSKKRLLFKENYYWDYLSKSLYHHNNEIILTPNERKLLQLFCDHINITISYDEMIEDIWINYEENKYNAIKILLKNLRKKLPFETIKNIYGEGYRLNIS
ncbi:MAG: response regulator transcription factor [Epsilonproteobacteria bacterium]|nr:response regulator transcription factor [Campylobacterota bacterium]